MCVAETPHRQWPWGTIAKIAIFALVLGFALIALKISPEAIAGGLFVSVAIRAGIKAGSVLIVDRRSA